MRNLAAKVPAERINEISAQARAAYQVINDGNIATGEVLLGHKVLIAGYDGVKSGALGFVE